MGDAENILPPSKKRAAGREITKDNPGLDDEEDSLEETGTFKKASDEVLASRRIVKVRRNQSSTTAPSSNPFAGIRLVTPAEPTEVVTPTEKALEDKETDSGEKAENSKDKVEEPVAETAVEKEINEDNQNDNLGAESAESKDKKTDSGEKVENNKDETVEKLVAETAVDKEGNQNDILGTEAAELTSVDEKPLGDQKTEDEKSVDSGEAENKKAEVVDPSGETNRLSSFQQLSSTRNAFTGLAGTGFSSATFSFGLNSTDGTKNEQPTFGFGLSTNGSSAIFNNTGPSIVSISKNEGTVFPSMQEVPIETGEENEEAVFAADSVLFEYNNGAWKERGKGELKVNVSTNGAEKARLLMRSRGNYRLILNASLYPDMKLTNMDKRGITFACINSVSESKDGLSTFALKFKVGAIVEEFRAAVIAHKDKSSAITALKTPENSPKASAE